MSGWIGSAVKDYVIDYAADKLGEIANSTSSPTVGGIAEFARSNLKTTKEVSKPLDVKIADAAASGQRHYEIAGRTGSDSVADKALYAAGMVANEQLPIVKGAVEAYDGKSYSSGDFIVNWSPSKEQEGLRRVSASTVAGTLGATRAITGGSSIPENSPATAVDKLKGDIQTGMSAKQIKAARQRGVYQAKAAERELIQNGHEGTVKGGWSWEERKSIAETVQYPSDTRWHHINDVKRNPYLADNPDNAIPSREGNAGHVSEYHPNGTRAGSSGNLLNREELIMKQLGE